MKPLYRNYLEPEYGEPSPEVIIDVPQKMNLENPAAWRHKTHLETIAQLTNLMKPCFCYEPLMSISIVNTAIKKENHDIPLRVYLPQGEGPFPVMVFYHGGGWSMNNLDVYDYVPRYFAKYGNILVIAPDYRLAPEHKYPQGFDDAYDTLLWAEAHAAEYGGSMESLTVCGDSAGGNFAAAVSLRARDEQGPTIHKQFLIYPGTVLNPGYRSKSELRYGDGGYFLEINSEEGLCEWYLEDAAQALEPYASPLRGELSGLPPACFISAECDPILDQGLMYAAKLEDAGVEVEYHLVKGMIHAFINRPYQKTFESFDTIIRATPPVTK